MFSLCQFTGGEGRGYPRLGQGYPPSLPLSQDRGTPPCSCTLNRTWVLLLSPSSPVPARTGVPLHPHPLARTRTVMWCGQCPACVHAGGPCFVTLLDGALVLDKYIGNFLTAPTPGKTQSLAAYRTQLRFVWRFMITKLLLSSGFQWVKEVKGRNGSFLVDGGWGNILPVWHNHNRWQCLAKRHSHHQHRTHNRADGPSYECLFDWSIRYRFNRCYVPVVHWAHVILTLSYDLNYTLNGDRFKITTKKFIVIPTKTTFGTNDKIYCISNKYFNNKVLCILVAASMTHR